MSQEERWIEVEPKNSERQKKYLNEIYKKIEKQGKEETKNDDI